MALQLACGSSASGGEKKTPAVDAKAQGAAGDVKATVESEAEEAPEASEAVDTAAPVDDDEDLYATTGKGPGQSPGQSPHQSPHQSPGQTPGQSPGQKPGPAPQAKVKIASVSHSGDACSEGEAVADVSPDGEAFTVLFSDFVVEMPAQYSQLTMSRSCRIRLGLEIPGGWQLSVFAVDYRGHLELPSVNSRATITTRFSFVGGSGSTVLRSSRRGTASEDFQLRRQIDLRTASWSPCGWRATLQIDATGTIESTDRIGGFLGIDTLDGEIAPRYALAWRRCAP